MINIFRELAINELCVASKAHDIRLNNVERDLKALQDRWIITNTIPPKSAPQPETATATAPADAAFEKSLKEHREATEECKKAIEAWCRVGRERMTAAAPISAQFFPGTDAETVREMVALCKEQHACIAKLTDKPHTTDVAQLILNKSHEAFQRLEAPDKIANEIRAIIMGFITPSTGRTDYGALAAMDRQPVKFGKATPATAQPYTFICSRCGKHFEGPAEIILCGACDNKKQAPKPAPWPVCCGCGKPKGECQRVISAIGTDGNQHYTCDKCESKQRNDGWQRHLRGETKCQFGPHAPSPLPTTEERIRAALESAADECVFDARRANNETDYGRGATAAFMDAATLLRRRAVEVKP